MSLKSIICAVMLASPAVADPVLVFAAASLKEPIDQLAKQSGAVVSYGGSGALARQILRGAPADVVLLANDIWMHELSDAKAVRDVAVFATNTLVLIGAAEAADVDLPTWAADIGSAKLAMGFTDAVPAGIYGRAALVSLGLYDDVAPNIVEVDNVRSALALVARGQAAYGITYATDARVTDAVRIIAHFPKSSHPLPQYLGGVVNPSAGADAFWQTVQSPKGQAVLAAQGFGPKDVAQ